LSSLAELAEEIEALLPVPPGGAKEDLGDCIVVDNGIPYPALRAAHQIRFGDDVVERREAVREWFRNRGREQFTWWIGASATPADLEHRLSELGAAPFVDEPLLASMALAKTPPAVEGIDIRLVESFEDFVRAREIAWDASSFTEEQRETARAVLRERWRFRQEAGDSALYLAFVDGRAVACGDVVFVPGAGFLCGAATLPEARGRGAFRALVRARWDEAVRRGAPALLVGAGKMSRPILERIGFQTLAEIRVLLDLSS
jgi:GNAT superfamily N-acetyltransferase